ncbi:hypothetical protein DFH27DRAFT_195205 [Peziza echinospora]|nr:hypothetical protein DFH27DRAFT_195205 [Peziza echinospora]
MVKFSGIHFLIIVVPLIGVGLMGTAGYEWTNISALHLPISGFTALITGLLPFFSLLLVQYLRIDSRQVSKRRGSAGGGGGGNFQLSEKMIVGTFLLLLIDTVIITLGTTHLSQTESCSLDQRWQSLYSAKSPSIGRIQDKLNCCGLHSPKQESFPYPSKGHNKTCVTDYPLRANTPCFPIWKEKDQYASALLIAVAASSAAIKVLALLLIRAKNSPIVQKVLYKPWFSKEDELPITGRIRDITAGNGEGHESDDETYHYDSDPARIRSIGGVNGGGGFFAIAAGVDEAASLEHQQQENGNGNGQLVGVDSQQPPLPRYQDVPSNTGGWGS